MNTSNVSLRKPKSKKIGVDKEFESIETKILQPLRECYPLDNRLPCAKKEYLKQVKHYTYEELINKTSDELYG
jgi:hypothetical protein